MAISLDNLIKEVDKLSTSKLFENYNVTMNEITADQLSSLSLIDARKLRVVIKRINKQLSEAAMLGGTVNDILGKHINHMQVKNAEAKPSETVASQLARMNAEIETLKRENAKLNKSQDESDSV